MSLKLYQCFVSRAHNVNPLSKNPKYATELWYSLVGKKRLEKFIREVQISSVYFIDNLDKKDENFKTNSQREATKRGMKLGFNPHDTKSPLTLTRVWENSKGYCKNPPFFA